ncbi:MAG TPA: IPT/TIG domain-containing protein [Candidatus Acidoferrum sp.]|nr:IPT/TIG domain-containing protein [Candidatus Acidoferrum sp.]
MFGRRLFAGGRQLQSSSARKAFATLTLNVAVLSLLAGCGGGSTGTIAPPPQQTQTPSITSFSPTSGSVGTSVTLTGTNFAGATSVSVGGAASTFSVVSATSVMLTVPASAVTGKIVVVTPQGSATSTGSFTVNVAAPTITAVSPTSGQVGTSVSITGTNFTGATNVKFNGTAATFSISDASHISTSVPAGATTGPISVVTPGGTATSSGSFTVTTSSSSLDLTIDGLYITQSTQNYPAHDVGLIAGRSAWVRVFVLANQANTAAPQVKVSFVNGGTTNTLTINAPGSSVPTTVDTSNPNASWNMAVPSAWITPGTTVSADVDPTNQIAESNKSNNHFSYGALAMASVHPWKITLIPIHTTDGRTGTVENSSRTKTDLVDPAKRLYPVPDAVDVVVGATFNSSTTGSSPLLTSSGTNWDKVLSELLAKRTADGVTDRNYFGFVNVSYTSGVAGLGYIGAPAAIGWDYPGAEWVLAHEEGHNFGRQHSPCGGAANPDPSYPYPGGVIGVPGWDVFATSSNLKATTDTDIMGYCSNQWISDYVYKSVLSFRAAQGTSFDIAGDVTTNSTGAAAKPGLLVWGRLEGGRMILEPAFRVTTTASAVAGGPYTWEAKDSQGRVVTRVPFQTYEVADMQNQEPQHFAFVVPMDAAMVDALDTVRVVKGESELAVQRAKSAVQTQQAMNVFRVSDLGGRRAEVHWDATSHPVLMLRDAKTGEVRGFLRGGDATIEDVPDSLELQLSDGVRSKTVLRNQPNSQ